MPTFPFVIAMRTGWIDTGDLLERHDRPSRQCTGVEKLPINGERDDFILAIVIEVERAHFGDLLRTKDHQSALHVVHQSFGSAGGRRGVRQTKVVYS